MQVYNPKFKQMPPGLYLALARAREFRPFNAKDYIEAKSKVINAYFKASGLRGAVIAISGGVDSAVALALLVHAKSQKDSPISRIYALSLPISDEASSANQSSIQGKVVDLGNALKIDIDIIDILDTHSEIKTKLSPLDSTHSNWASGQLVALSRTPFIYYATNLMVANGYKSAVVGTTNRDEGAYLGYVGKASDGMVDIQVISDLHKSEVFAVGSYLGVPQSILNAVPSGDMFDGRSDVEVFGASYDFVELLLLLKSFPDSIQSQILAGISPSDRSSFEHFKWAIENLHQYNAHKYLVGSPAIHLDILPSAVKGGWVEGIHSGIHKVAETPALVPTHRFYNFQEFNPTIGSAVSATSILSPLEERSLTTWARSVSFKPTSNLGTPSGVYSGADRVSFYSPEFAEVLFLRLIKAGAVPLFANFDEVTSNGGSPGIWKAVGVNPMFRLLRYQEGGEIRPHFDYTFVESKHKRSMLTLLVGVQEAIEGGETVIMQSLDDKLPFSNRDFSDTYAASLPSAEASSFKLGLGQFKVFNHATLHKGLPVIHGSKLIIRSEIMFEFCGI